LQGIPVANNAFAGGAFDWLRPFPIFIGLALIPGYALLGATWLLLRTEGELADRSRAQAKGLLLVVLVAMAIVSLWTPLTSDYIAERWFSWPNILYLSPVPLLTALAAYLCWRGLETGKELTPFLSTIALFLLGFAGLAISNLPYLVPTTVTLWEAAAPPESQIFILVGTLILLPLILGYTIFNYWTFRGKVRPGEGYH
jgi:cytochrome d ubiquinol oxidase subunit II